MTNLATKQLKASELSVGTQIKLEDGFSPSYAIVTAHVQDRWGHHCKVQIVSSSHEGRQGRLESIQGSETLLGIGWKVGRFIKVDGEVREVTEISPDGTRYTLLGGAWVQWNGAWSLEDAEQIYDGDAQVEL